jgi:hypothetical protein
MVKVMWFLFLTRRSKLYDFLFWPDGQSFWSKSYVQQPEILDLYIPVHFVKVSFRGFILLFHYFLFKYCQKFAVPSVQMFIPFCDVRFASGQFCLAVELLSGHGHGHSHAVMTCIHMCIYAYNTYIHTCVVTCSGHGHGHVVCYMDLGNEMSILLGAMIM